MTHRILVVDDDPALLKVLRIALGLKDYEIITAPNGEQGITAAAMNAPELIVLDLGLPDVDGVTVCRRIREWSDVPIIVLSATDTEGRKVAALDAGANDYVTKPFGMAELEARIRVALRTRQPEAELGVEEITVGPLQLNLVHREAHFDGSPLKLTSREFDLLAYLGRYSGKVCTHQMILQAVWGDTFSHERQYLHAYIYRLRQKMNDNSGDFIRTVPGIGYALGSEE